MVQVLPYVPSNAERIAPAVGQGIINAIEGYKSAREKSNDEKILKQLENPDLTPAQRISAISSLSEKKQKGVGILYKDLLETQEKEKTHQEHLKTFAQKYGVLPDQQQPQQQAQPNPLQAPVQQSTNVQQAPNIPPQQAVQQPVQQGVIPPNANAISPQAENIQPQRGFNPKDPQSWTDEEIVNLAEYSHSPYPELKGLADVAKQEAERRKVEKKAEIAEKKIEADRENEIEKEERALLTTGNKKFFEHISEDRNILPKEENAFKRLENSVQGGDLDPWSSAHFGSILRDIGVPEALLKPFETPGSKEAKTASKDLIAGRIQGNFKGPSTGRQINLVNESLAELGVSKRSNKAALAGIRMDLEIRRQRIIYTDELIEQGIKPSKIPAIVDKKMQSFTKEITDEYIEYLEHLKKS